MWKHLSYVSKQLLTISVWSSDYVYDMAILRQVSLSLNSSY